MFNEAGSTMILLFFIRAAYRFLLRLSKNPKSMILRFITI